MKTNKEIIKDIEHLYKIRKELMKIANSYAGNLTGCIAVNIHHSANRVLYNIQQLEECK